MRQVGAAVRSCSAALGETFDAQPPGFLRLSLQRAGSGSITDIRIHSSRWNRWRRWAAARGLLECVRASRVRRSRSASCALLASSRPLPRAGPGVPLSACRSCSRCSAVTCSLPAGIDPGASVYCARLSVSWILCWMSRRAGWSARPAGPAPIATVVGQPRRHTRLTRASRVGGRGATGAGAAAGRRAHRAFLADGVVVRSDWSAVTDGALPPQTHRGLLAGRPAAPDRRVDRGAWYPSHTSPTMDVLVSLWRCGFPSSSRGGSTAGPARAGLTPARRRG